jgi:hypothetical protein
VVSDQARIVRLGRSIGGEDVSLQHCAELEAQWFSSCNTQQPRGLRVYTKRIVGNDGPPGH